MGYVPFLNFNSLKSYKPFFSGFSYPAYPRFNFSFSSFETPLFMRNYTSSWSRNGDFSSLFSYRPAWQSSYKSFGIKPLSFSSSSGSGAKQFGSLTGGSKIKALNVNKAGWGNALNLSNAKLTQMGFNTAEKQWAFRQLKPEMQNAVLKLTEYAESQGIKISYNSKRSIFRTRADQEAIYRTARKNYAAKPGSSRHETGEAVDIHIVGTKNTNDPKYKKLGEYWQSMGYMWGGNEWKSATEPWHFDLRPTTKRIAA